MGKWNAERDAFFIRALVTFVGQGEGNRVDNGFHKDVWKKVTESCNAEFQWEMKRQVYKTRQRTFKTEYAAYVKLSTMSGFGMDASGNVTAPADVWDRFAKVSFFDSKVIVRFINDIDVDRAMP